MICSIINVKETKRKIRAVLKQLNRIRRTEQNLCELGVTIRNIDFSGIENLIVMSYNNVKHPQSFHLKTIDN
jgi:hypothetical protein